jgi:hypothetical protein
VVEDSPGDSNGEQGGPSPSDDDPEDATSSADEAVARTVAKYCLYAASRSEGFIYPIVTLFLLSRDLSYTEVGLVNGLFLAGTVAGGIPTDYVADRLGRRNSLIVSSAAVTAVMIGFTCRVASSPEPFARTRRRSRRPG